MLAFELSDLINPAAVVLGYLAELMAALGTHDLFIAISVISHYSSLWVVLAAFGVYAREGYLYGGVGGGDVMKIQSARVIGRDCFEVDGGEGGFWRHYLINDNNGQRAEDPGDDEDGQIIKF